MNKHLKAIRAGEVTKTNVIGLRKAMNANARRARGLSTSRTCPNMSRAETDDAARLLREREPRVSGELHASGLKLLQGRRYKNRWSESQARIVADLAGFALVGFEHISELQVTPVFRAIASNGDSFVYRNVAWQSGGDGPEVLPFEAPPGES